MTECSQWGKKDNILTATMQSVGKEGQHFNDDSAVYGGKDNILTATTQSMGKEGQHFKYNTVVGVGVRVGARRATF